MTLKKLFGTDGIRGIAGRYPLTSDMAARIGRGISVKFHQSGRHQAVVIGQDTRISGPMLATAVASGFLAGGWDVYMVGTLPTPGIARLTLEIGAAAGIVISASHNPYTDNGIKIFNAQGFKLTEEEESEIEKLILNGTNDKPEKGAFGRIYRIQDAEQRYATFLLNTLPDHFSLNGMKIVLDCANGATWRVAPKVFGKLGAEVVTGWVWPNGRNINENCGSEHPERISGKVVATRAAVGFAFDGDGDRLIAVDENGSPLNGDLLLAIYSDSLRKNPHFKLNPVVSTVMSNMGLTAALSGMDISHKRTAVGDRHVVHEMRRTDSVLGGEDSGHIVFLDHHTTGDGIYAALKLLMVMQSEKRALSALRSVMNPFPQTLINLEVKEKPDIRSLEPVNRAISEIEEKLGKFGRVLVRYSGTQPLCRVMVEGREKTEVDLFCRKIADLIEGEIGVQ